MKRYLIVFLAISMACISLIGCKKENTYVHVGPRWDALNKLNPPDGAFDVSASGDTSARVGKDLFFKVKSEKNGRLWVVQVDPEDHMNLLFPNDQSEQNDIKAGETVNIPPEDANWAITADKPLGKSILAFIVTTGDGSISDIIAGEKDLEKAVRLIKKSEWSIKKMVIDIQ